MTENTDLQIAYLEDGQEVELIEQTAHGVIIRRIYEYEEGGGERGDPEVVSRVFEHVPLERFDKRIKDLQAEEAELLESIRVKQEYVRGMQSNQKRFELIAKQNAALGLVCDFFEGKITHYLFNRHSDYSIVTA